ncbi:MAG: 3'-5' exonuclease [Bacteroides sp.]|nr:3'-5' exonuclease [Bacteroides sp.]
MKDFAAIDFETANGYHSSVCSVGVVIVRDGKVVEEFYRLIHPAPNYYNAINVSIHGLTRADTDNADYFPEVWAEVAQKIEGLPLVAHNSRFDESCLKAAHERYEMTYPNYEFHCTCNASRRTFGRELPNHKLDTVAAHCGFDLTAHHNALADAQACAAIALAIL